MRAIRSSGTGPERRAARLLRRLGLRYRSQARAAGMRVDFLLPDAGVAVQVHGCFWHGHSHVRLPGGPRAAWWAEKIARNASRDERDLADLRRAGWRVVVLWECRGDAAWSRALRSATHLE